MDLKQLFDEQGRLIHEMEDIYSQANKEKRSLNTDEETRWQKIEADLSGLEKRIKQGEELKKRMFAHQQYMDNADEIEAETRAAVVERVENRNEPEGRSIEDLNKEAQMNYSKAFRKLMLWGPGALSPAEHRAVSPFAAGVKGPEFRAGADQPQISSNAGRGGYLSPEEWSNFVIEKMKAYGGMLANCRIIPTKGGDTLHIPVEDVTTQLGAIIAQGTADAASDTDWTELTLSAFTYTSKIIKISEELYAEDDAFNVLGRVQDIAASRVGRKVNYDLTLGAGTTEPEGVTVGGAQGKLGASQTGITRTELIDLIHSIDPAYRMSPKFMLSFNDNTLAIFRKLSIGSADDRPLWVPSMREGAPATLEGVPYFINQDLPNMATSAKSIVAADWDNYYIRMVRNFVLRRSDERFWDERVIAYFMTARLDGKVANNAAVKYFQNAAA